MLQPVVRIVAVSLLVILPFPAAAITLTVSNTGVDSPTCGPTASPCRSITRAVLNSMPGDRVLVGPGVYSDDLDVDGLFGEAGEEPGAVNIGVAGLTVESTGGAAGTLIRRRGGAPSDGIVITASDVEFGKASKGFTVVTLGNVNSAAISAVASGVEVVGNVIAGPVNFSIGSTANDGLFKDNRIVCSSGAGSAFFLVLGTGSRIDRNTVQGCQSGFLVSGAGNVITRNLAIGNGVGFGLTDFAEFSRNAALANTTTGASLGSSGTPGLIFGNTFAGNGTAFGSNCGLTNNTGGAVTAAGNFWGAATGPGADPADQVCNSFSSTTITSPVATTDSTPKMAAIR